MVKKCEACHNMINKNIIIHIVGFPEQEHIFCSDQCLGSFLRMEDDMQEYTDWLGRIKDLKKQLKRG